MWLFSPNNFEILLITGHLRKGFKEGNLVVMGRVGLDGPSNRIVRFQGGVTS